MEIMDQEIQPEPAEEPAFLPEIPTIEGEPIELEVEEVRRPKKVLANLEKPEKKPPTKFVRFLHKAGIILGIVVVIFLTGLFGCQSQPLTSIPEEPPLTAQTTVLTKDPQTEISSQTPTNEISSTPTFGYINEECASIPSGLCYLSFQPAIDGYTQTFRVVNKTTNEESLEVRKFGPIQINTQKPGEEREDRFSYDLISGEDLTNIEVYCRPEGLIVNDIPAISETGYQYSEYGGESFETLSINYEGVTYPRDPKPGEKWTLNMEWIVKMDTPLINKFKFTAESEFTYVGTEIIEVPAGTFTARRFEMNTTMKLGPLLGENTFIQVATIPISATSWQADCVGFIKFSYRAMDEEKAGELIEFNYP